MPTFRSASGSAMGMGFSPIANGTWASFHDAAAATDFWINPAVGVRAGTPTNFWGYISRTIISINCTGFLGTSSAILRLDMGSSSNNFGTSGVLRFTGANPASPSSLALADFLTSVFSGTVIADDIDVGTLSGVMDIPLNADGLALLASGWVSFGIRTVWDIDDSPPAWVDLGLCQVGINFSASGDGPKLITPDMTVQTDYPDNVTMTTATLNGTLVDDAGNSPVQCQFFWGQGYPFEDYSTTLQGITGGDSFFANVTGLSPASSYMYKAKAIDTFGNVAWGDLKQIVTESGSIYPSQSLTRVSAIIHRWTPGSYTMEVSLGGLGGQFTPPFSSRKPTPILTPDPSGNISNLTRQDYENWLRATDIDVILGIFGHFPTFEEWAFWVVANR